ncbi:hypothetical protein GOQ29_05085 [Clostridium sp. D2Q-14]|uniref:hypothetical protein n=1 Tax=Anaeromonas gelatinilytica TaxID=2683194 RepID=UPI00193C0AEA|nr:hypothetical protein [Anaeromonas gelatinilytica]MBS4534991.1 hypothetical protein [Anaeromonas gelatinilytica]
MDFIKIPKTVYIGLFKLIGIYIMFVFTCGFIIRNSSESHEIYKKMIDIMLRIFMLSLNGVLLFFTLFFDFKSRTISLMLPESISLYQLLMTLIAGCGAILNLSELVKKCRNYILQKDITLGERAY